MVSIQLWKQSPTFLQDASRDPTLIESGEELGGKPLGIVGAALNLGDKKFSNNDRTLEELAARYTCWYRLSRKTVWWGRLWRFHMNYQLPDRHITTQELEQAEHGWIRYLQRKNYREEIKAMVNSSKIPSNSAIKSLNPFIRARIVKVGGRLEKADIPNEQKHPILLPRHHITDLIIRWHHVHWNYAGVQLTLSMLQRSYWIVLGRNNVRAIIGKCKPCRNQRAATSHQLMADLPEPRVRISRPFTSVGVDYDSYGLWVQYPLRTPWDACEKRWREGGPGGSGEFVSPGGDNMAHEPARSTTRGRTVGGSREVLQISSQEGHRDAKLNYEEYDTLLEEVSACLNSRPLCPDRTRPEEIAALTPRHFLIGQPLLAIPAADMTEVKLNRLNRWQRQQQLVRHLWKRWSQEYLQRLQRRVKWKDVQANVKIRDVGVLKDEEQPPQKWKLARVVATHIDPEDKSKLVRAITVKTEAGTYKRPITKFVWLLSEDEDEDDK
ncbi:unnamed protein product [Allacma fusca]|uniref:DUF5641 domain-containing protein n=1 Tax=Allacma fusca TaxID=39272 RepID=A0A8J2PEM2_9HEXA|nr:unnamed protein product [Allacma fusca]